MVIMQTIIPWQKIKALEEEIETLKSLGKKQIKKPVKTDSLKGILKGVHVTWKEFQEVKKMWFDEDHILYQKHKK